MSLDGSTDSLEFHFSEPVTTTCSRSVEFLQRDSSESPDCQKPKKCQFTFENRESLAHDLTFLAVMPELCDVTFFVGDDRQPVCGVKAIMAARSGVFRRLLYDNDSEWKKNQRRHLKKKSSEGIFDFSELKGQQIVFVEDFDMEVFKQLVDYIHTGAVMLQARTILGLMNAADHYGIEDLRVACMKFMEQCITVDRVCALLASAERYIQYKTTKVIIKKMFEFVDQNADTILQLEAFLGLPQHIVRIIFGREELQTTELKKFTVAMEWCRAHLEEAALPGGIKEMFEPFVDVINYCQIPAKDLMQTVKPAQVVDTPIILTALAYQADPGSISQSALSSRHRRQCSTNQLLTPQLRRVQSSGIPLKDNRKALSLDEIGRGSSLPPGSKESPASKPKGLMLAQLLVEASRSDSHLSLLGSSTSASLLDSSGSVSSLSAIELDTSPFPHCTTDV